jgi:hypothetical protein
LKNVRFCSRSRKEIPAARDEPQEYVEYFEDLSASGGLKLGADTENGEKGVFFIGLTLSMDPLA